MSKKSIVIVEIELSNIPSIILCIISANSNPNHTVTIRHNVAEKAVSHSAPCHATTNINAAS
jgi:hypothetical protein